MADGVDQIQDEASQTDPRELTWTRWVMKPVPCPTCQETGKWFDGARIATCPTCQGTGQTRRLQAMETGRVAQPQQEGR